MSSNYGSGFDDLFSGLAQRYGSPQTSPSPDVRQSSLPPLPQGSSFAAGIQNANSVADEGLQTIADKGAIDRAGEQPPPIQELSHKVDKNGQTTVTARITGEAYDHLAGLIKDGQTARMAFDQARQMLAQKQAFLQQNPIVAGLGAIASGAAARYAGGSIRDPYGYSRIAPLVQAAGAYGLSQFGRSPDQLAQEQAALAQEGLKAQEPVTRAILGQQEMGIRQQGLDIEQKKADIELAQFGQGEQDKIYSQFSKIAQNPAPISPDTLGNMKKQLMEKGMTAQAADEKVAALKQENEAVLASQGAQRVQKVENVNGRPHIVEHWLNPRTQSEVGKPIDLGPKEPSAAEVLAAQKKKEEDDAIEDAAQRAVSKDPNLFLDPKQIASTRNLALSRIYKRAGQLDPTATPAALAARTKTYADYVNSDGKTAQAFASQGQFLQHAKALQDAAADLKNTNAKMWNMTVNEIKNQFGDEAVERVMVALDPAKKEFEKFLISSSGQSNRALYESDRKSGDQLLNRNMPLKQLVAGLHQMAETTSAVNNELVNKWQRVFPGHPIPNQFSPEALAAAEALKTKLKTGEAPANIDLSKYEK